MSSQLEAGLMHNIVIRTTPGSACDAGRRDAVRELDNTQTAAVAFHGATDESSIADHIVVQ